MVYKSLWKRSNSDDRGILINVLWNTNRCLEKIITIYRYVSRYDIILFCIAIYRYSGILWHPYHICSSTVTARHHFRPPDFSKQFREKSCQTMWIFWKVWNFGETSCIKWCNWKCMVSEQSYMSTRKWSLVVNSRWLLGTLFLQLGDWRIPHGPPSGSTSHPSTRPATFQ
jgi:hypothetical protein